MRVIYCFSFIIDKKNKYYKVFRKTFKHINKYFRFLQRNNFILEL